MDVLNGTSPHIYYSRKSDRVEPTKVYSPLSLYQQLNLNNISLYTEFGNYLLTRKQLRLNGFPESSPVNPSKAVLRQRGKIERGTTKRTCCRCAATFQVYPDGTYKAKEPCRYHPSKQVPVGIDHRYRGCFPCCFGKYVAGGCMTCNYHVTQECSLEDVPFVKSTKSYSVKKSFSVYAIDCEMVYTTAGMEVAKVGVVGIDGTPLFESFVLPQNPILDYNTLYSGVTEEDLRCISTTLEDVQDYLLELLSEHSILVGHGLENDLKVLRLIHDKVVDTSVLFPNPQTNRKKSLKDLAQEFLFKSVQSSECGHDCIEDARTSLELVLKKIKLVIEERPAVKQPVVRDLLCPSMNPVLKNSIRNVPYRTTELNMRYPMWNDNACKRMNYGVYQNNNLFHFPVNFHPSCIY